MHSRKPLIALALLAAAGLPALAQEKPTRVEVSGLPALNFDADEGFGYGAIVQLYGYDANPSVYRWTLQPTVFLTTRGRRDYTAFFDMPSRPGHPWRVTAYAGREQQLSTPYYDIGNNTSHDAAFEQPPNVYYYRFGRDRLRATADLQHALGHPALRFLIGGGVSTEKIDLSPFDSGTTLIQHEARPNMDGRSNYLRLGLTYDTRDREVGAHSGTWADVLTQRVDKRLGATDDYTRTTATVRHYQPLGDRLTFANRLLMQNIYGSAPFYALSEIQTTQKSQDGLGGASTIRGLSKDRFIGKGTFLSNNELRWRALDFTRGGRQSSIILSSFVDAGRVWADGVDPGSTLHDLHYGYGGGVRLAYGPSFVVSTDYARSGQSTSGLYIGLGYLF